MNNVSVVYMAGYNFDSFLWLIPILCPLTLTINVFDWKVYEGEDDNDKIECIPARLEIFFAEGH